MKMISLRLLAVAILTSQCLAATPTPSKPPEVVRYLPPGQPGIALQGQREHHVGSKALFDYMDGGAERYLAYGVSDLGVQNYTQGEASAVVEIYRMGSPADAFGIYAGSARGEHPADMGATATLAPGMLSFFKDRYYVRVVALSNSSKANDLIRSLAKATSNLIPGVSAAPAPLKLLPNDPVDGSLRYLPNKETARTEWFSGEGEALFGPGARGVLGSYRRGDKTLTGTLMSYPDAGAAVKACLALAEKVGLRWSAGTEGACRASGTAADGTFATVSVVKSVLRWVTGAPDQASADALLGQMR
jgi:hypothetical protein